MRNRREIPFLLHPVALKAFKAGLLSARAAPNKCHSLNVQINDSARDSGREAGRDFRKPLELLRSSIPVSDS